MLSLVLGFCASYVYAFTSFSVITRTYSQATKSKTLQYQGLSVANLRDADFGEMMVGGQRYEMVPLPDSMMETTLFVGNLCEFVKDEDLERLFRTVSSLKSVPACVSRKPNWDSLRYGFVTFPNVEEKEKALLKFQNYELNGRPLKVEPIRDTPGINRVRVPERMVMYMCGEAKRTSDGRVNTLRRVARAESAPSKFRKSNPESTISPKRSSRPTSMKLSETDEAELNRALRRGYVSLPSTAYRRGRSQSALATAHRAWCDDRGKPHVILCKASGGRPLDYVIVDLSPLRIHGILDDPRGSEDFLLTWKAQILLAAERAGMILREDYVEDNTVSLGQKDSECAEDEFNNSEFSNLVITMEMNHSSSTLPIGELPSVSIGVFEGERSKAKAMAKELAELWDIPESITIEEEYSVDPRQRKPMGKSKETDGKNAFRRSRDRFVDKFQ